MTTPVNDRDVRLQATSPRFGPVGLYKALALASSTPFFKVISGTPSPASATLTASLIGLTTAAAWAITGGTLTGSADNVRTLTYANMSADTAQITATVVEGGITYTSTTFIAKISDGLNGGPGGTGARGTVNISASGYSAWSDSAAASAISSAGYGSPSNRDIVTLYNTSFSQTKYYQSGAWLALSAYINGNMLVSGTLSASQIYGGILDGVQVAFGTGHTPTGRAFELNSGGVVWADNIFAGIGSFGNINYSGSALTGQTYITNSNGVLGVVNGTNSSASANGLCGRSNYNLAEGFIGCANTYDFYATGPGVNYGPFTGAHDVLIPNGVAAEIGDIVVDVTCVARGGLSNTIFEVAVSSAPRQRNAFGVLATLVGDLADHVPAVFSAGGYEGVDPAGRSTFNRAHTARYAEVKDLYQLGAANALGEGQINVCGEGGDIEAGDYIVTSSMAGKGMRQEDDLLRNYTVAKARESVVFSSPTEIKQIACFYVAG